MATLTLPAVRHEVAVVACAQIARVLEPQVFCERKFQDLGAVGGLRGLSAGVLEYGFGEKKTYLVFGHQVGDGAGDLHECNTLFQAARL